MPDIALGSRRLKAELQLTDEKRSSDQLSNLQRAEALRSTTSEPILPRLVSSRAAGADAGRAREVKLKTRATSRSLEAGQGTPREDDDEREEEQEELMELIRNTLAETEAAARAPSSPVCLSSTADLRTQQGIEQLFADEQTADTSVLTWTPMSLLAHQRHPVTTEQLFKTDSNPSS